MRGQRSLPFFLVLLYAASGRTQLTTSLSPSTEGYNCTQREGTSITVLMDPISYQALLLEDVLNPVSGRFPCVTRQYTAIILDNAETHEIITNDKSDFLKAMRRKLDYFYQPRKCNQSLFYGLKRALEISPADSIILVYRSGLFSDLEYIEPDELDNLYSLLEQKTLQVYIFSFTARHCEKIASDENILDIFHKMSSLSYGGFFVIGNSDNHMFVQSMKYLLPKPLNSSVRILNLKINVTEEYTAVFNVTASLSCLLIRLA
ncbi:uncharacterized protein LOC143925290 [Lithobates pipiens]